MITQPRHSTRLQQTEGNISIYKTNSTAIVKHLFYLWWWGGWLSTLQKTMSYVMFGSLSHYNSHIIYSLKHSYKCIQTWQHKYRLWITIAIECALYYFWAKLRLEPRLTVLTSRNLVPLNWGLVRDFFLKLQCHEIFILNFVF